MKKLNCSQKLFVFSKFSNTLKKNKQTTKKKQNFKLNLPKLKKEI